MSEHPFAPALALLHKAIAANKAAIESDTDLAIGNAPDRHALRLEMENFESVVAWLELMGDGQTRRHFTIDPDDDREIQALKIANAVLSELDAAAHLRAANYLGDRARDRANGDQSA